MPVREQVSGTHGFREDDAIKRQDRDELQEHGDEWPEPESGEDEQQDETWAPEGRLAGAPQGEDWRGIELRSELARHLSRSSFPATAAQLTQTLTARQAEQRLLDLMAPVPADATFASLAELLRALDLPVEERPA